MNNSFKKCALSLALSTSFVHGYSIAQENDSLWDLSPEELMQVRLTSLATGTATPLDKAAAITTVITESDIEAMGATDLDQVLETVPGLHVSRHDQFLTPNYFFRGITSTYNPQTLLLINGIPLTNIALGNRSLVWGGMPVNSIARIEVIRGPGSALHGADAYAGVINVITKSGSDIAGTEAGVRAGSFDTQALWLLHGTQINGVNLGFTLEYETTDGHRKLVQADAQTLLDEQFGTNASLAPGPVNAGRDSVESRLDIEAGKFKARVGYQGRFNVQTGMGVSQALDPQGQYGSERFNVDVTHTFDQLAEHWPIVAQLSYLHLTQDPENNSLLYPPGAFGDPAFSEGLIGNPGFKEQNARFQLSTVYSGLESHRIRIGSGTYWGDLYEVTETKNFYPDLSPRPNGLESVSDTPEVWLPEKDRTSYYAFVQDEWQFAPDWQLTSGVRYDRYSDFGDTLNPRAALIWATTNTLTTKLLYGRAFRAPSVTELYVTSNPVALGNPDLGPETIDTYELAFSHQPDPNLLYSLNLFYYRIKDYITFVPVGAGANQAQNTGEFTGRGFELETTYRVSPSWQLVGNYAYQRSEDEKTNERTGGAPNHELYGRSDWQLAEFWQFSTQVTWVGEQKRGAGDARPPVSSHTTVDLTLRRKQVIQGMEVALSVRNLFDDEVYEPSRGPNVQLPYDIPMPGRNIYGEVRYTF